MASKYYAVKKGKKPGVYRTWDECKAQTDGFSGAIFKSFKTQEEAEAFIGIKKEDTIEDKKPQVYAFVDGSFNVKTGVYGYGGFLFDGQDKHILSGSGDDAEMATMRNVAGEILGSMAAVEKAIELGIKELSIYYDYMGIEMWATGAWKRNKEGTIAYHEYMNSVRDKIQINFIKVKGHSGVEGNEEADILAKKAVGVIL
ncbi:MAG: ribonuclease H family protein [Agathobacter sp.]|nr:ribonuclease H family protein [Agathobacter sp.]